MRRNTADSYNDLEDTLYFQDSDEEIKTFNYLKSDNSDDILQMYLKDIGKQQNQTLRT